tara:strand:+ start:1543 stop:1947 length:405 start_codon:yes stop_codon:yes gene_type:complete
MLVLVDKVCSRSAGKVTFTTNLNMTKPSFFENNSKDFMAKPRNEYPLNNITRPMTDMASKEDEGSIPTTILVLSSPPSFSFSFSLSFCVRVCVCVCVYSRIIIIVESAVRGKRKEGEEKERKKERKKERLDLTL